MSEIWDYKKEKRREEGRGGLRRERKEGNGTFDMTEAQGAGTRAREAPGEV